MAALTPVPKIQFFAANGEPLVGGKLYSYAAGTTTPLVTYTDQAATSANTNPVILDSRGEASVWLGTGPYKLRLTTATDVDIWTVDDIYSEGALSMQELLSSSGSSLVGFIADGTGAQYRTVQSKLRDTVSVKDFGAVGDGTTDDSAAFQAAVNALPAAGGQVSIGPGSWLINTNPTVGTKSIFWNIDPGASFSGTGVGTAQFLSMSTNPNQLAAGPYIESQSTAPTPSAIGGIGAFSVEMIQPSTYNGSSVALYAGASSASAEAVADVWAINALVKALAGATGIFQGAEIDVDTYASGATTKGIGLNGVGNYNATVAVEIIRADSSKWTTAVYVANSLTGVQIETSGLNVGLLIGGPVVSQITASLGQLVNNGDTLLISRKTDTAPTGYYVRFVNAANSASLFSVDVAGNVNTSGGITADIVTGANFRANAAAVPASAGVLAIGSATSTTATAGVRALPSNPLGFLEAYIGTTLVKIPYYSA
jgi:hypothetical protein